MANSGTPTDSEDSKVASPKTPSTGRFRVPSSAIKSPSVSDDVKPSPASVANVPKSLFDLCDSEPLRASDALATANSRYSHTNRLALSPSGHQEFRKAAESGLPTKYKFNQKSPGEVLSTATSSNALNITKSTVEKLALVKEHLVKYGLQDAFNILTAWETIVVSGTIHYVPTTFPHEEPGNPKSLLTEFSEVTLSDVLKTVKYFHSHLKIDDPEYGPYAKEVLLDYEISGNFLRQSSSQDLEDHLLSLPTSLQNDDLSLHCRLGPVYFYLLWEKYTKVDHSIAINLLEALKSYRVSDESGENVSVFSQHYRQICDYVNSIQGFQASGTASILLNAYLEVSIPDFVNYFKFLQFGNDPALTDVPSLIVKGVNKFVELVDSGKWHPTTKTPTAFVAQGNGTPGGDNKQRRPGGTGNGGKGGDNIDRTPPANGAPKFRTNPTTNRTEYWCGICKRWGNHPSKGKDHKNKDKPFGHKEFEAWQAKRAEKRKKKKDSDAATTPAAASAREEGANLAANGNEDNANSNGNPLGMLGFTGFRSSPF